MELVKIFFSCMLIIAAVLIRKLISKGIKNSYLKIFGKTERKREHLKYFVEVGIGKINKYSLI